jgi:hypothetical protein
MNNKKGLEKPLINLHFQGKAIHDGRILLDDLFQFVYNLDLAIQRIISVIQTGTSSRIGRPHKEQQLLSALEVVAIKKGSFALALDLRRDEQNVLPGFDTGIQAIERLMYGLGTMEEFTVLPEGFDRGVLIALREAGRVLDRGIDEIDISSRKLKKYKQAKYIESTRTKIISNIRRFEQAWTIIEGRLLMADLKEDSLNCRIYPSTGSPISCHFDESMTEHIVNNLRGFIQARGEAEFDSVTNRIYSFVIRDLEPIEAPVDFTIAPLPKSAFWSAKEFDELAIEQEVRPIDDWDSLSGGFPEDADFDSFLEAIQSL